MENAQGRAFLADVSRVFCGGELMDDLVCPLQPKSLVGTRFAVTPARYHRTTASTPSTTQISLPTFRESLAPTDSTRFTH